eukprot:TRINITY_DN2614_c0_g1_i3.p1 TRINITY_DN2614_c0_g1~~TRINITY_DN2614_c0_g1_i3.p1  ORF type:complete len:455 (+),score=106.67 TRINITY_DN2614_c0_g1_i3:66-1367(+)
MELPSELPASFEALSPGLWEGFLASLRQGGLELESVGAMSQPTLLAVLSEFLADSGVTPRALLRARIEAALVKYAAALRQATAAAEPQQQQQQQQPPPEAPALTPPPAASLAAAAPRAMAAPLMALARPLVPQQLRRPRAVFAAPAGGPAALTAQAVAPVRGFPAAAAARAVPAAGSVHNFVPTQLCKFHFKGKCKVGPRCTFAHSKSELESCPRLAGMSGEELQIGSRGPQVQQAAPHGRTLAVVKVKVEARPLVQQQPQQTPKAHEQSLLDDPEDAEDQGTPLPVEGPRERGPEQAERAGGEAGAAPPPAAAGAAAGGEAEGAAGTAALHLEQPSGAARRGLVPVAHATQVPAADALQVREGGAQYEPRALGNYAPGERPTWLPRRMCVWHMRNQCARGEACTFAHTTDELRDCPRLAPGGGGPAYQFSPY